MSFLITTAGSIQATNLSFSSGSDAASTFTTGHLYNGAQDGYLYEPIGYNNVGNTSTYPLIIFLHGQGERGTNPSDLLGTGLPEVIDNGQEEDALVFAPQLAVADSVWFESRTSLALEYVRANRRVDNKRIYITGLSLGAEGCYRFVEVSASHVAASLPVAGTSTRLQSSPALWQDVPTFIHHGTNDGVVGTGNSPLAYIALTGLEATTASVVPPGIWLDPDGGHNETFWNGVVYDKTTAIHNYSDWLFKHSKDHGAQASYYITTAESSSHLHDYLVADYLTQALTSSAQKTSLVTRLNTLSSSADPGTRVTVNFGPDAATDPNINNISSSLAAEYSNLIDHNGNITTIDIELVDALSTSNETTGIGGWNFGLDDTVRSTGYRIGGPRDIVFKGLTTGHSHSIYAYTGRDVANYNNFEWVYMTASGANVKSDEAIGHEQTLDWVEINGIVPNGTNQITCSLDHSGSLFSQIMAIRIVDVDEPSFPDQSPPEFSVQPFAQNQDNDSIEIASTLNEPGTTYVYNLPTGSSEPSQAVMEASGTFADDSGAGTSIEIGSLVIDTTYDFWVLAKDTNNTFQTASTFLTASTTNSDLVAPSFTFGPSIVNITTSSLDLTASINENGTIYAITQISGSVAPTVPFVIASGSNQVDSGSGVLISFGSLNSGSNYSTYVVADDSAGNNQTTASLLESTTLSGEISGSASEDVYFNFNSSAQSIPGYNDVSGNPHTAERTATDGTTGIGVSTNPTSEWNVFGGNTSNNTGGETSDDGNGFTFNSSSLISFMYSYLDSGGIFPEITITGLDPALTYRVRVGGSIETSLVNTNPASQSWSLTGSIDYGERAYDARSNTSQYMEWTGVSGSLDNSILLNAVDLNNSDTSQFFILGAIRITSED